MKNEFVIFYSIDKRFYIYIDPITIKRMRLMYEKNANKETGGIIIGYYSNDLKKAYITSVTDAPEDSIKSFSTFLEVLEE